MSGLAAVKGAMPLREAVRAVLDRLKPGDGVNYQDLRAEAEEVTGVPWSRQQIQQAVRLEHQRVTREGELGWRCEPRFGYVRMRPEDSVEAVVHRGGKARRQVRWMRQQVEATPLDGLSFKQREQVEQHRRLGLLEDNEARKAAARRRPIAATSTPGDVPAPRGGQP